MDGLICLDRFGDCLVVKVDSFDCRAGTRLLFVRTNDIFFFFFFSTMLVVFFSDSIVTIFSSKVTIQGILLRSSSSPSS